MASNAAATSGDSPWEMPSIMEKLSASDKASPEATFFSNSFSMGWRPP